MKRAYGEYQYHKKELMSYSALTEDQRRNYYLAMLEKNNVKEQEPGFGLLNFHLLLEHSVFNGNCIHYFFAEETFLTWLQKCKTKYTNEMSQFFYESYKTKPIMFHFRGGNSEVYLIKFLTHADMETLFPEAIPPDSHRAFLFVSTNKGSYILWPDTDNLSDTDAEQIISGALAYIQCFPEMVANGIPDDLNNVNHYRKVQCNHIKMAPRLIERDGVSPHYRTGHFRLLSSDRFVNKKGQIVFVTGSFVKGKAKTVYGEPSKLQKPDGSSGAENPVRVS